MHNTVVIIYFQYLRRRIDVKLTLDEQSVMVMFEGVAVTRQVPTMYLKSKSNVIFVLSTY